MEDQTLKITSALADPTRYSIYQYIFSLHEGVTVQKIADQFNIHPNVARLHLTKLEDVQLLTSKADKTGKGGRPGRIYELSNQLINIQFPPRNFQLLSEIAIESLLSMGKAGEEALKKIGYRMGNEIAHDAIRRDQIKTDTDDFDSLITHIRYIATLQGIKPEIEKIDPNTFRFRVYNCTFMETAAHQPAVCQMHHALLSGMFEVYFGKINLVENSSMLNGCKSCEYTMIRIPDDSLEQMS